MPGLQAAALGQTEPIKIGFRWLGVAGFELTAAGFTLLVDPYLTRISFWQQWAGRVQPNCALLHTHIPRADAILISHAHVDHLLDAPEIAQRTGATVYGSANVCQIATLSGLPRTQTVLLEAGDRLVLGPFAVQVFASEHLPIPGFGPKPLGRGLRAPLRAVDYQMDACYSLLIEVGGRRLLTDPGMRPDDAPPADLLLIYPHHNAAYFTALFRHVRPQVVLPTHWDDMWQSLSRPLRPTFRPPWQSFPPLRRVSLDQLRADVARAAAQLELNTRVIVPRVLTPHTLEEWLT
ncbi:MAG: MBL fold metallo-hydrolase [Anaerolineae bacterium]|nr:MBL fold metallo-hydrolase [Anaerolineae bacterium]